MNESTFTRKIRKKLESSGWFTEKISQRFSSGFPDFIAICKRQGMNGEVYFVEVKELGAILTKLQFAKLKKINSYKCNVRLLRFSKATGEYIYYKLSDDEEWEECKDLIEEPYYYQITNYE